jgi:hypothetical protein
VHHVGEDAEDDEVADEDAHRGAHERIDAAAVASGPDVAARGAQRGRDLEAHLPEEEHEHAGHVEPVGQERAVPRVRALLGLRAADGEDRLLGLARQQVAATRASARQ